MRARTKSFLGIAGIVVLLAGASVAAWALAPLFERVPLDEQTQCPKNKPLTSHTVVLVDETDALSDTQARRLRALLDKTAGGLELYGRLTVLLLDSSNPYEPKRIFSMCAPKNPGSERALDGNQRLAKKRWDAAFGKPLDAAIDRLKRVPVSARSPIVESLKGVTWMPDFGPEIERRQLLIFSDLLQLSEGLSHYRGKPDYLRWKQSEHGQQHRIKLRNVSVWVEYIERPQTLKLQNSAHRQFWIQYFADTEASLVWDGQSPLPQSAPPSMHGTHPPQPSRQGLLSPSRQEQR